MNRGDHLGRFRSESFDVLIIGGGINGAGVARDLALRCSRADRPLKIALIEQNHFASGTSGKNSQLIHGGLRYLKTFEFGLVRESLRERATLLRIAPHLVKPLAFLMPAYGWTDRAFFGLGLTMYDLLAGSQNIGKHRSLSRARALMMEPHLDGTGLAGAAVFYDCLIHSARFVLENVIHAARHGTVVVNYLRADDWQRSAGGYWRVSCTDKISGEHLEARARKLVNATGPWNRSGTLRLVRGSHIVIPRATSGDHAIAWFEPGGRIVFVIPWGEAAPVSLVGTTDVDHTGTPDEVEIAAEEREYLVAVVRRLFPKADTRVISSYASLRPLVADESSAAEKVSRQHRIWNDANGILHIAGGKYTTYRVMSAEAAGMIAAEIAPEIRGRDVTADAPLPGLPMPTGKEERVRQAYELEMAQTPDDVLHVSTYWGYEGVESPC